MNGFAPGNYGRLVIKVGSSLLIDNGGELNRDWLEGLAADIAHLKRQGSDVLVVSSGAIAIGCAVLDISIRRARLEDLQAAAAAGQVQLAHAWREVLSAHDIMTAQVLLTPDDTENRRRFLNARGTLGRLLERSVVPVINENDTVATDEIRYGDNDRLAARIAQLVMADGLLLLSDVDGFYTDDPGKNADAEHVAVVPSITDAILGMAGETRSDIGSGGMSTKVQAARIATHAGCSTIICSGLNDRPVRALSDGARCTVFPATASPQAARKQWLAGVFGANGSITVDSGAANALASGKSLLPVGIVAVSGDFRRGDVVIIIDSEGSEIGRGLAEYGRHDAEQLIGCRSERIEQVLGYRGRSVMIHRDGLVLFDRDN